MTTTSSKMLPILKIHKAKIVSMLTNGIDLWGLAKAPLLEQNQVHFLRTILRTDRNTTVAVVRVERGTSSSITVIKVFNY